MLELAKKYIRSSLSLAGAVGAGLYPQPVDGLADSRPIRDCLRHLSDGLLRPIDELHRTPDRGFDVFDHDGDLECCAGGWFCSEWFSV